MKSSIEIWENIDQDNLRLFMLYYTLYQKIVNKIVNEILLKGDKLSNEEYDKNVEEETSKFTGEIINNNVMPRQEEVLPREKIQVTLKTLGSEISHMIQKTEVENIAEFARYASNRDALLILFPVKFDHSSNNHLIKNMKNFGYHFTHDNLVKFMMPWIGFEIDQPLGNIDFEHVNLADADFENVELENCVFHGTQIKELSQSMKGATLKNCRLVFDKIPKELIEGCLIHCLN